MVGAAILELVSPPAQGGSHRPSKTACFQLLALQADAGVLLELIEPIGFGGAGQRPRQARHAGGRAPVHTVSDLEARAEILDEEAFSEILQEGHYDQVKS